MILVGDKGSKRTGFLQKAAGELGLPLQLVSWQELEQNHRYDIFSRQGAAGKIDPPSYSVVKLSEMEGQLARFQKNLRRLEQAGGTYLNAPSAILTLLDKRVSKERLQEQQLPTTTLLPVCPKTPEELFAWLEQHRVTSVFIKPRFFSGAAGVMAFRRHLRSGRMSAYTSCYLDGDELVNTKTMYQLHRPEELLPMLERLLRMDCVIERWYPKEQWEGKSFDLRIVYQFHHIAYIVVRRSDGPITNLQLNNQAMSVRDLGLNNWEREALNELCRRAVSCFPGLNMAGIDVMLDRGSRQPRIIEMNGQGDLIYQDIYGENRIYREQCQWALGRLQSLSGNEEGRNGSRGSENQYG